MNKNLNTVWTLGIFAVLYFLVTAYSPIIGPLTIGALIAYLLYPLVVFIETKSKLSHSKSSIFVFLFFTMILITIISLLTPILIKQFSTLENTINTATEELAELAPVISRAIGFEIPIDQFVLSIEDEMNQFLNPNTLFRVIQSATANIFWVIIIFVSCFFWLKDWVKVKEWFYDLFSADNRSGLEKIHGEIKVVWHSYLRGQFLMMLLIGSLSAIGGAVVGLKGAMVMGLIAGGLALIPSIGPAIATTIAGVLAWTQGSSYINISNIWFAILVVGIYVFIQFLEGTLFQPMIMSKRLSIHPGIIIIAVVSTISLLGVLAGLVIVPVIGSAGVLIKYFRNRYRPTE